MSAIRPTILDVARLAGVSKSVVSRVTTGKGSVSQQARTKVLAAMDALDYRSNVAARHLKLGSCGTVGILLRNVLSSFYATLFANIQAAAASDNMRVVGATGNMVSGSEEPALESLLNMGVDALIIGSGHMPNQVISRLAARIPTVVLARPAPDTGATAVFDDPDAHASGVIEHLWALGHRDCVLLAVPQTLSSHARATALHREAAARGMKLKAVESGYEFEPGEKTARQLLADDNTATAWITLSYPTAVGAINVLTQNGVRVPADLSVIAADADHNYSPYLPDITGTTRDATEFAQLAWAATMARLSGAAPSEVRVPVRFHDGATTGPPRGGAA